MSFDPDRKMETIMFKTEFNAGFNYDSQSYRQASANPGFWDYVGDVVKGIQRYFRIRNARRTLAQLPDHALKDIGIGRAEIDTATASGRVRDRDKAA
jgi:uncharacterized protein YjiS (DUF1127 family)